MNHSAEYREQEYEMDFPKFKQSFCDSCHRPIEEGVEFNHHLKTKVKIILPLLVCEDCIQDVIQYRHKIRNVSEMTGELKHKHDKEAYYKAYDNINFNN